MPGCGPRSLLTLTQPPGVTAAAGLDILCHALESWTAKPYTAFDRKEPGQRVPYCGANPVSDMWAERALRLLSGSLRSAVRDGTDVAARGDLALAATFAGMGFGNAGVHLPHAGAYPIAGQVRDFRPAGYPQDEPLIPHGMAVALTAPEAFRFTFPADPERHLTAAAWLDHSGQSTMDDPVDRLPRALVSLMRDIGLPSGLAEVGYTAADTGDLVAGAMKQQRLLAVSPRAATEDDLATIFDGSMELW
jgi:hydroxyacid-oxoacid transhydrogenase